MKNARFAFTDFRRNIAFVDSSVSAEKNGVSLRMVLKIGYNQLLRRNEIISKIPITLRKEIFFYVMETCMLIP